ncbi:transmembrane protein, putative, partial [Rhizoctonia solani AG-3 Rhs1AP]
MADPTRKKSWKRRHPILTVALLPAIITWTTIRISLKVTAWSVRTTHNLNKRRRQRKRARRQQAIDRQRRIEWEAQQWRTLQKQLETQQQRQAKVKKQPRQRWLQARRPPPPIMCCSAQSLEPSRECLFDPALASSPSATAPVATTTQPMEQSGQRLFDPASTASHAITAPTTPVAPITTVESLQSALASSQTPSPDSTPTLASSALPTLTPLSSIPRPLPLGTTMIVQGLVQTIEVSRIPARTHEEPRGEETRPLLDKGKAKEEANDDSGPLASGSTNTSVSPNTPDTLSNNDLNDTHTSESNTASRTSSPSSTDVLGLLLSIAAQATAEALVPWSVPPRSRTAPREGIASGLAAAFSALAGAGAGVTTTNANPSPGITVPEPLSPPAPTIRPLTPHPHPHPHITNTHLPPDDSHDTPHADCPPSSLPDAPRPHPNPLDDGAS